MSDQAEGLRVYMRTYKSLDEVFGPVTERNTPIDFYEDGYWFADSKAHPGVWSLLRKSTDRQTYGQPWKNMDTGKRMTWMEIQQRFSRLVKVEEPK